MAGRMWRGCRPAHWREIGTPPRNPGAELLAGGWTSPLADLCRRRHGLVTRKARFQALGPAGRNTSTRTHSARIAAMTSQAVAGELVEADGAADARIAGQAGPEHGHDGGRRSRPGAGLLQGDPVSGIGRQPGLVSSAPRPAVAGLVIASATLCNRARIVAVATRCSTT